MFTKVICERCNGSGEGQHETILCEKCHAVGEVEELICTRCSELMNGAPYYKGDVCASCYDELFNCQSCGE